MREILRKMRGDKSPKRYRKMGRDKKLPLRR
jgi:hypothetical protein